MCLEEERRRGAVSRNRWKGGVRGLVLVRREAAAEVPVFRRAFRDVECAEKQKDGGEEGGEIGMPLGEE